MIDWIAYGHAVRTEKNTENFGRGDIRGLIAAISSDNAKEGGHLVPTIAFGVPAGASMAILLSAFLMHGLVPGPEMLTKHLDVTYSIIWTLTLAHIMGAAICIAASGLFARLATVRVGLLLPLVLTVIFIGAYQGSQSWGDLYSMVLFGTAGWAMKHLGWPRPPLILGFVLGGIFERYFFISTEIYGAAWVLRPVVIAVLIAACWVVIPSLRTHLRDLRTTFSAFSLSVLRFERHAAFTLAIIVTVLVALMFSLSWPAAAKFVPRAAAFAALLFAALNLATEILAPRRAAAEAAPGDPHAAMLRPREIADAVAGPLFRVRALRYFGWLAGFLVSGAVIGMLPSLFLFVLLQMRLEFREGWMRAASCACVATLLIYLLFDRTFSLPWPQALIGDLFPALRDASGLV